MADILFLTPQIEANKGICEQFLLAGHQVDIAGNLEAAEALLQGMSVDVLVLDSLFCGGGKGVEFILGAKSVCPNLLIILSVSNDDQAVIYELLSVGIITTWIKNAFQNKELLSVVENVLRRYRLSTHTEPPLDSEWQNFLERRKSPRKEARVSVRWRSLGGSARAALPWATSQTRNINLRGLMFETDVKLDVYQYIMLEICLPSQEEPIQANGEIRWTRQDARQNKQEYGIQLMDLEESDMVRLLDYLSA